MQARLWWLCALLFAAPPLLAQWVPNQLKQVVILTRHGVRSPLNPMGAYAQDAWPDIQNDWHVDCCGDLTPAGENLVRLMGVYYRAYYTQAKLLPAECPAPQVYVWADNEERTMLTARQLALGLGEDVPGCNVEVQSLTYNPPGCSSSPNDASCQRGKAGPTDLWFHPLAKLGPPDPAKLQQVADGINRRYDQLEAKYRPALLALQMTLLCCKCPGLQCTLLNLPHQASVEDGTSVKWSGAFNVGSTAAEIFLLEYATGLPCSKVGWGRAVFRSPDCAGPGQSFRLMQEIHTAYFQEIQRNFYIAQIQGSNITNQILAKLEQAAKSDVAAPRLVIFAGHDTNIANVAGLLGLSWRLADLPENDTPPAGALVFELYTGQQKGTHYVRVRYVHQTLLQLRTAAPLTLQRPPDWAQVEFPKCPGNCDFQKFSTILKGLIDPKFVSQNASDE